MHMLCTICSDLLGQSETITVTKCGHLFHQHCLAKWIERSATCPQCRARAPAASLLRVFPTAAGGGGGGGAGAAGEGDEAAVRLQLDDAQLQLRELRAAAAALSAQRDAAKEEAARHMELVKATEQRLVAAQSAASALRQQAGYLRTQADAAAAAAADAAALREELARLGVLRRALAAGADEARALLEGGDPKSTAVVAVALKRALVTAEAAAGTLRGQLRDARAALRDRSLQRDAARAQLREQTHRLEELQRQLEERGGAERSGAEPGRGATERGGAGEPEQKRARVETADVSVSPAGCSTSPPADVRWTPAGPAGARGAGGAGGAGAAADSPDAASPYFALRRAALPLTHKPSELSLFRPRALAAAGAAAGAGAAPDGLGGRARVSPERSRPPARLPRRTALHRLRRPAPAAAPAAPAPDLRAFFSVEPAP